MYLLRVHACVRVCLRMCYMSDACGTVINLYNIYIYNYSYYMITSNGSVLRTTGNLQHR